jgi:hypothetical protein
MQTPTRPQIRGAVAILVLVLLALLWRLWPLL